MRRIDDPQSARTHCDIVFDANEGVSNVTPMRHARDQTPDRFFRAVPVNRDRNSAHLAPEIASSKRNFCF
jgi:hypothetical protein